MLQISQLDIAPGQSVRLRNVTWPQYKKILEDIGTHRAKRMAYNNGRLQIMVPHSRQEDDKEIISDLIKALLEERNIEFRALGSTLFERQSDLKAIEPDQCFYIHNEKVIRGKRRIDLNLDPPPDLVLEMDKVSPSRSEIFSAFSVPEVWHCNKAGLFVHKLASGRYLELQESPLFPDLPIKDLIPYCLEQSRKLGRNVVMRDFRQWIRNNPYQRSA